uniref:Uncharacterized protein n=1 Tax=viral metagenome TaxID=1070528 RepID=A0A6M3IZS6_9ZZZZ
MTWTSEIDFDLAALTEMKSGEPQFFYFGNRGMIDKSPYIALDHDAGVGDKEDVGGNQEILRIDKLNDVKKVHLFCWDYKEVQQGGHARFHESDIKIAITENNETEHTVSLDSVEIGNVVLLATIDNTDPSGARFVNRSEIETLKHLNDSQQFINIANR